MALKEEKREWWADMLLDGDVIRPGVVAFTEGFGEYVVVSLKDGTQCRYRRREPVMTYR